MRTAAFATVLAAVIVTPAVRAEPSPGAIAVLPLSSAEERTSMYGKPVADALASGLRGDHRVEVVVGTPPARFDLVVDGSILVDDGRVMLEARVRDPDLGKVVGSASTGYRELTHIDRLADELAGMLSGDLDRALAEQQSRRTAGEGPLVLPEAVVYGRSGRERADREHGRRPAMLVYPVRGAVARGNVSVGVPATRAARTLAAELGFRPLAAERPGPVAADRAARDLERTEAAYALAVEVERIGFSWKGVLLADGRLRFEVFDRSGRRLYRRSVDTGTLVGSRGDRHRALVHFVARQAATIAAPEIGRSLPARGGR